MSWLRHRFGWFERRLASVRDNASFVHKQSVERGCVEACEEHAHHDKQIDLLILHSFCQVAVVVLKFLAIHPEARFEQGIVIIDCLGQKLFGTTVMAVGSKFSSRISPTAFCSSLGAKENIVAIFSFFSLFFCCAFSSS